MSNFNPGLYTIELKYIIYFKQSLSKIFYLLSVYLFTRLSIHNSIKIRYVMASSSIATNGKTCSLNWDDEERDRLLLIIEPAPMAHSYRLGLATWRYQARIPVSPDICHCVCAYTVLQTVQRPGVYSAAYGTVHYKETSKSFEIRVGHSLVFGLPSVCRGIAMIVQKAT